MRKIRQIPFLMLVLATCGWASDKFVGPCYQVRGRLSFYNGTPATRIWIIGTHRMLGVRSEDQNLPANVKKLLKGFNDRIFGDFTVCPLTKEQPGKMRIVFVQSSSHVVNRPQPYP